MITKISESNRLPELATQIHTTYTNALAAIEKSITEAMSCGDALTEAKALVPHGQWGAWLAENTQLSERSAQRYMQLSRERPTLEAKTATVADLTIKGACELIAKPPEKLSEQAEAWRLIPGDGLSLLGIAQSIAGTDFILITPSTYAEYFYVTHIWLSAALDADNILPADMTMSSTRKPTRWQSLPQVAEVVAGIDIAAAKWTEQPFSGTREKNPWSDAHEDGGDALWEIFFPDRPSLKELKNERQRPRHRRRHFQKRLG